MAQMEQPHCLVCTAPIRHAHLGVDSCRACSVFYKRTASLNKKLKCKGGADACIEENPKSTCRKCRFARFSAVLESAINEGKSLELPSFESSSSSNDGDRVAEATEGEKEREDVSIEEVEEEDHPSCSFIDHNSFSLPARSGSFFDRLRSGYSLLCVMRRAGEFGTCPMRYREGLSGSSDGKHRFVPATYLSTIPNARIMYSALMQFSDSCFADFRSLAPERKEFIIKQSFRNMSSLDSSYRACHYFPDDETLTPSYTVFINNKHLEGYLDDCPNVINREEANREMRKNMERTARTNKLFFKRVAPTDEEFLALLGLSLWSNHLSFLDESLSDLVSSNQSSILHELHLLYSSHGRTNYASRLGDLLCLLVNIEKCASIVQEDLQVYRLMNLFSEELRLA